MEIDALVTRFEEYAITLKELLHVPDSERDQAFFHIDIENYQDALSRNTKPMALLLQTPEVEKSGLYDNLAEGYDFVFVVLNFRAKTSKAVLLATAKQLAAKLFKRMMTAVTESDDVYGMLEGTS